MTTAAGAVRVVAIESGLAAHFKQPDGLSRPGVDWLVRLQEGEQTHHVRVKALLADDASRATRKDEAYQAQTAMQYLQAELDNGWHPSVPREHTIHIGNPHGAHGTASSRPWWRFW